MSALPESVRRRVVDLAADRLGQIDAADVPASLRPFAKFAPGRRRQVVLPIAAALESDSAFRALVADGVREALPDLVAALEAGEAVPAADPDDVAAIAYLLRVGDWESHVSAAAAREAAAQEAAAADLARRTADLAARNVEAETSALQAALAAAEARAEQAVADLEREKRRAREAVSRAGKAEAALAAALDDIAAERATWTRDEAALSDEVARLRAALGEAEALVERLRRDTRDARDAADTRRWLLLDTLSRAVSGLREELGVAPASRRPADFVEAASGSDDPGALPPEDPATVDRLLALPNAHLIVDGYNVTKSVWNDQPLEDQRTRLVSGLAALAARTSAEITCVFDGAEVAVRVPTAAARRVRVRFSPPGQIADELIRRLVRAEPAGRPVVVCSADREVVDGVRRSGARVVYPPALLARVRT